MKFIPSQSRHISALVTALAIASFNCFTDTDTMSQTNELELTGKFKEAAVSLNQGLESKSITAPDRKKLELELDRLERIKKDFPSTAEKLFNELKGSVKNLTRDEFDR